MTENNERVDETKTFDVMKPIVASFQQIGLNRFPLNPLPLVPVVYSSFPWCIILNSMYNPGKQKGFLKDFMRF